jgi:phosphatidate cytidylyltransferase
MPSNLSIKENVVSGKPANRYSQAVLKQRVITASILAPLALWGIYSLDGLYFSMVVGVIILLGAWEWGHFVSKTSRFIQILFSTIVTLSMFALYAEPDATIAQTLLYAALVWWMFGLVIVIAYPQSEKLVNSSQTGRAIAGWLILVPAWLALVMLHQHFGPIYVLILMLLIWGADVGAYFAGSYMGKHKLAPKVSPKKTWEGVLGGIALALIAMFILMQFITLHHSVTSFLVISLLTISISILGDLVESLFKRSIDIKDSGNILPGHGGILDRIDSLTAAAPFFYLALVF